jgi:hypothetical protein
MDEAVAGWRELKPAAKPEAPTPDAPSSAE